MKVHNIQEAKTHLSRLVERALAGEQIVIAKAGRLCVQLTPFNAEQLPRTLGGWEGKVWIASDFDAPSREVEALFEGSRARQRRKRAAK
jgi:antitoxin (DNA-binding transcriptional repressor) of toxin-antitoxin stability system